MGTRQSSRDHWRGCLWAAGLAACGLWPTGWAAAQVAPSGDAWQAAVAARASFEAEPREEHTRDEFSQVMDNFRAIYHSNPADLHAPRAVDQVAQLLAEQGRELKDPKSLRAAAGQYEFLAKAYPGSSLAGAGLALALELLGPDAANDADEAAKVRVVLQETYPRIAAARVAAEPTLTLDATEREGGTPGDEANREKSRSPSGMTTKEAAPAVVTGIRHWSTATYTRVAIDLGGEVEFQAARVEHPDRIFFDLHGAKLAAGLAGKSFAVTDDGFLKTIRAGQFGPDVTRVVLDVQPVAEYSAFLLPNPYRLIIDIHGKASQPGSALAGQRDGASAGQRDGASPGPVAGADERRSPSGMTTKKADPESAADSRSPAGMPAKGGVASAVEAVVSGGEVSSLPPMPVTDGSSTFGLPAKRDQPVTGSEAVARPRVVVSAKPTVSKPVPNTVTSAAPESNREVAAVSDAPGVVTATARPTSKPVVDRAKDRAQGAGRRVQPAEDGVESADTRAQGAGHRAHPTEGALENPGTPVQPPPPTANGQSTLMRALGLKIGRIVIDAGHGGHDSGTLGPEGIEEKDVVLDVALRLGKLLHDRLGAEVVYTRADDTFIPLETRTAIANKAQADLFISVHANSSADADARGVEVYYLNFTSDPEAMQVASRENAVSSQRVTQLSDLVKKIALKDKIDESRELAADVDQSLYAGLRKGNQGLKDRGVKKAPFVVLIGANMPSILAEISFVTNPEDAAELNTPAYRERVAESLYTGIARYAGAINGAVRPGRAKVKTTERAAR